MELHNSHRYRWLVSNLLQLLGNNLHNLNLRHSLIGVSNHQRLNLNNQ